MLFFFLRKTLFTHFLKKNAVFAHPFNLFFFVWMKGTIRMSVQKFRTKKTDGQKKPRGSGK